MFPGDHILNILADLKLDGTDVVGFIGITRGGSITMMAVGILLTNITKEPKIIGRFSYVNDLYINGIGYGASSTFSSIGGCSVGSCTDTQLSNRATVNVTGFTKVVEGEYTNFYMV